MKKLLLILLCLPMIGFGQACQYGSSTDASELCDFYRGNNFATYRNADIALDKILDVTGMSKRFVLEECRDITNCIATTYKGIRYILYDKEFMDLIATRTNSWSNLSILAHEVGHHVNGHTLGEKPSLSESRQMELEADEYSGFVMFKLGASLSQAQEAIRLISTTKDDSYSTHPSRVKRERAIAKGYNQAKSQGSNNDYSTNSSTLTAEDYFYKAYNNEDDQYKIDNYTKCLRLDPDYPFAYANRGYAYYGLDKYNNAIADFRRALNNDKKDDDGFSYLYKGRCNYYLENYEDAIADFKRALNNDLSGFSEGYAYFSRAESYHELELYEEAIADYTRAIRIDPKDYYYLFRGDSYYDLELYEEAIADFTRANNSSDDEAYGIQDRGRAYRSLGLYEKAITDFTRVIIIDPDDYSGYFYRALTKEDAGKPYCSDYKRACDLGDDWCCERYYKQCR